MLRGKTKTKSMFQRLKRKARSSVAKKIQIKQPVPVHTGKKILVPLLKRGLNLELYQELLENIGTPIDEVIVLVHPCLVPKSLMENKRVTFHKFDYGRKRKDYLSKKRVFNLCKSLEYDVIFCLSGFWNQLVSDVAKTVKKCKSILYVVDDPDYRKVDSHGVAIARIIAGRVEVNNMKRDFDLIVPISRHLQTKLKKARVNGVSLPVPMGVDMLEFYPNIMKNQRFVVGYAGVISKSKGSNLLKEIIIQNAHIRFVITGEIMDKSFFSKGFPDNVSYQGNLPQGFMPKFYQDISLLLVPSVVDGFPRCILEAYSSGIPIMINSKVSPVSVPIFGFEMSKIASEWGVIINEISKNQNYQERLFNVGLDAREFIMDRFTWKKFRLNINRQIYGVMGLV